VKPTKRKKSVARRGGERPETRGGNKTHGHTNDLDSDGGRATGLVGVHEGGERKTGGGVEPWLPSHPVVDRDTKKKKRGGFEKRPGRLTLDAEHAPLAVRDHNLTEGKGEGGGFLDSKQRGSGKKKKEKQENGPKRGPRLESGGHNFCIGEKNETGDLVFRFGGAPRGERRGVKKTP